MENTVNERVDFLIKELGLNQNSFAKRIGVGTTAIQNIITGRKSKPSFDTIQAIAVTTFLKDDDAVKVSLDWLIIGQGDMFYKKDLPPSNAQTMKEFLQLMKKVDYLMEQERKRKL